jgi:hypothetical protein
MKKKIALIISSLGLILAMSFPVTALAAAANPKSAACAGLSAVSTTEGCGKNANKTVNGVIKVTIDVMSYIVGIGAVIMLIVSGIKYIFSGGESNAVASAKNGIIYSLVGIFVAVLAQWIVARVFNTATQISGITFIGLFK